MKNVTFFSLHQSLLDNVKIARYGRRYRIEQM